MAKLVDKGGDLGVLGLHIVVIEPQTFFDLISTASIDHALKNWTFAQSAIQRAAMGPNTISAVLFCCWQAVKDITFCINGKFFIEFVESLAGRLGLACIDNH